MRVGHPTADVLALDHDGDGDVDLLVSGGTSVTLLEGDGAGGFHVAADAEAGDHPVDIAPGHLDGDGHLDVVVANHETDHVTLLFGGPGGLGSGGRVRLPVDVSPHPHAVALADVDEDGHLDILVDDRDRERLRVLLGNGARGFRPGEPVEVGGDPYRGMTLADVDGDGHVDVVAPLPTEVVVRLGDGSGRFAPGPVLDARAAPPFSTAVADLDGDGHPDIASGSGEGPGAVTIWWGRGDGTFTPADGAPFEIAEGPTSLATGDVDRDGVPDLLVTSYLGDEVAVLVGGRALRVVRVPLRDHPWGVAAGDFDGDGVTDLATASDGGPDVLLVMGSAGARWGGP